MFRLDRLLTLGFFYPLGKIMSRPRGLRIPILMYHSISDDHEKGVSPYYRVTTSPARFRQHMEWLRRGGYSVIDLSDAVKVLKGGSLPGVSSNIPSFHPVRRPVRRSLDEDGSLGEGGHSNIPSSKPVVLTFDDGFRDFHLNAWPILKSFGYPATVYLATNYVGKTRKAFKGRECLTWEEVRNLHTQGVSFGSHTASHPTLYGLAWEEIRRELAESREKLEKELQAPISRFSYPYAFPQEDQGFVRRFREELRDTGYTTAVTTAIGRARKKSDSFCLPRLPVNEVDDLKLFDVKLCGDYDWMAAPQTALRSIKSRLRKDNPNKP